MLTTEPSLSDDVHRYLWDGHLVSQGVNPYSHPIEAAELDAFEIDSRLLANNPQLAPGPWPQSTQVPHSPTCVAFARWEAERRLVANVELGAMSNTSAWPLTTRLRLMNSPSDSRYT